MGSDDTVSNRSKFISILTFALKRPVRNEFIVHCLCDKNARATDRFYFLFRRTTEELRLDDHGLVRQMALAQHFVVTRSDDVNDGRNIRLSLVLDARLLRDQRPQLVEVQRRAPVLLLSHVKVTHTDLAKVTWMVFIKVDTMMMLTAGITATARVLSVFSYTTVPVAYVTTHLSAFLLLCRPHLDDF